jgi:hypothetical protein
MRLTELLRIATLQEFYKADRFFTSCDVCIGHTPRLLETFDVNWIQKMVSYKNNALNNCTCEKYV